MFLPKDVVSPALPAGPIMWTTDASLRLSSLTGYGPADSDEGEDLCGQPVGRLASRHSETLVRSSEATLATAKPQTLEVEIAGLPHTITLHPTRDGAGAIAGTVGVAILQLTSANTPRLVEDLIPRIEVLARLQQSEERHRTLVQNAPYCIHEINNEGCLTSMNPAGLDMMGVEDEAAIVGLRYLDIIVDADRSRIAQLLERALDGEVSMFEFEATNGQFFQSNFIPILDQEKKVVRMMGLTQNITERKLAQRALKASEQRLELALEGAELGLWDLDLESGLLVFNTRWASMLGLDPALTPHYLDARMERVHPDELALVEARLQAHLRGETETYTSEHRVRSATGQWRWIHERGAVVARDEKGAPLRLTGTAQDLTERHRLTDQLQQSQKMDSIGQLAGGVAHDFNNLLVAIMGHAELAALNIGEEEELHTNLDEIKRASERAAELTRRLLVFSRQQQIQRANIDLNSCVEGLLKMLDRLLPETMTLELDLAPGLPKVSADASQLEHLIVNLCVNARDAMPEGGRLWISTRACEPSAHDSAPRVALLVRDEGVGMSEALQARMFEPFFTTKPAGAGTGLGLSMVYGIVKKHEGHLHVESQPGEGSTFVIELPEATDEDTTLLAPPTTRPSKAHGQTVLVVEDEELVCKLVVSMLERNGYRVLVAVDGLDALERLDSPEGSEVALVLMDVVMPRMGGYEARDAIRSSRPQIKVLMTSGYVGDEAPALDGAETAPMLVKPYSMDTLLHMIGEQLDADD